MEPSGGNRWQSAANRSAAKRAEMVRRGRRFETVRELRVFPCLAGALVVSAGASASVGVHAASTVAVVRRSVRRAGGSHDRVRRAPGDRSARGSWSGSRPFSGRGRKSRCQHGARRSRRCVGDRRPCAEARFLPRVARASTPGTEVVQVEVAAPVGRKKQRAVRTRRLLLDRIERDRLQRHRPPARLRLRALQPTFCE
jgi:hypothetical protein